MQFVEPEVHMLACTQIKEDELRTALENIGAEEWVDQYHRDSSDSEVLIEVAGRMCYKSFGTELNKNITKTREGNAPYIGNILKSKHGSVLEHASVTFAVLGVSRIFTHELVRHRAGTAFSQESGRFVRIDEVRLASSEVLTQEFFQRYLGGENENAADAAANLQAAKDWINHAMCEVELLIGNLTKLMIHDDMPFDTKKKIQSFIRRFSPNGQVNDIIFTANHRALRHMIAMRTHPAAEEEIRKVFHQIAMQLGVTFPNIYQDMGLRYYENESNPQSEYMDTSPDWSAIPTKACHWVFANEKV
jgi:thymidylate synthase (FAD)